jgi:hypothetical protein
VIFSPAMRFMLMGAPHLTAAAQAVSPAEVRTPTEPLTDPHLAALNINVSQLSQTAWMARLYDGSGALIDASVQNIASDAVLAVAESLPEPESP